MTQQQHYNLETLVKQLIQNRAGNHNSLAELTDKEGKSKGLVIVDLQYNKQQNNHVLKIAAPGEVNQKHRGIASYVANFVIAMNNVDIDKLVKNVRTTASAMTQLVGVLESNIYIDFAEVDAENEKLRKAQQERKRKQLASRTMREGSRGVSG